ncbi:MAG TPA: Hsp20/alpha crystallin family protein [Candidatus Absconditabacterales bacterium]|nr:Hsp20/alpha crystallin family protein [Candidatus Absconditabacterales bacterium]HNG97585.1 Hsp20/alpha crystallin family protein [Candidatus Absconditabacterales bacterium]
MKVDIPMDMYESSKELVVIMPLAGVERTSLEMRLDDYKLLISGKRNMPKLKEDLMSVKGDCYRGEFSQQIDLPIGVYLDRIHSKITQDNILFIVIPKIQTPDKLHIEIE